MYLSPYPLYLLADMILLTRCEGLVIASDGGLAHMFLLASCARRVDGACPPHIDLWQCQPEAMNNYIQPSITNNNISTTMNTSMTSPRPPPPPIPYRFMTDPMLNAIWFTPIKQQVDAPSL